MTQLATQDDYGVLTEPTTLTVKRLLPGPIDRVWAYLTDSDKRRLWLAAGDMEMHAGSRFTLTWRNDELTDPPGNKPEGFGAEHSMDSEITELDPPRKFSFTWGSTGGVTFELEPAGDQVLLTLTHRRIANSTVRLNVSAGWHAHLDVLAAKMAGERPEPFWDRWAALKADYARRVSA